MEGGALSWPLFGEMKPLVLWFGVVGVVGHLELKVDLEDRLRSCNVTTDLKVIGAFPTLLSPSKSNVLSWE